MSDKINGLIEKLVEKLQKAIDENVALSSKCTQEFLDTSLPEFADAILPAMASCVENNATDIVSNAFGKFKDELVNVEKIGDIIGESVSTCIAPPDATNTNESLLKCVKAVSFLLNSC